MSQVDIKDLLAAGAHFGHKTSRWHPKMAQYIHSKRGGSHVIDLVKTVACLEDALAFVTKTSSEGMQKLATSRQRNSKSNTKNCPTSGQFLFSLH